METEGYLHETSPITHFQYVDQYYAILKIKRGHVNITLFAKSFGKKDTIDAL